MALVVMGGRWWCVGWRWGGAEVAAVVAGVAVVVLGGWLWCWGAEDGAGRL